LRISGREVARELDSAEARTKTFGSVRSRYLEKAQARLLKLFAKTRRSHGC
jgi:hypothetical protein